MLTTLNACPASILRIYYNPSKLWSAIYNPLHFTSMVLGSTSMTMINEIEINPKVMLGKPVIRGTRITVELILRKLSEGATLTELLDSYPQLTQKQIRAAIRYAADALSHEETIVLTAPKKATRK